MSVEIEARITDRNQRRTEINWNSGSEQARTNLNGPYPTLQMWAPSVRPRPMSSMRGQCFTLRQYLSNNGNPVAKTQIAD